MRITALRTGVGLFALGTTLLVLACTYLVGYWSVFGEQWHSLVTVDRLVSLPFNIGIGFSVVAAAFVFMGHRLKVFACGQDINIPGLIFFALCVLAAMYVAIYDVLTLKDVYPFAGLLVVSLLLFRFESRVVAAVLVGVIMLSFYAIGAKELGERDAERMQLNTASQTVQFGYLDR